MGIVFCWFANVSGISRAPMGGRQVIVAFRKSAVAKPGDDTFATETDADPVCLSFNQTSLMVNTAK